MLHQSETKRFSPKNINYKVFQKSPDEYATNKL